jgi:hypothetical protein
MPVARVFIEGRPAYRWGNEGEPYFYAPGNEESEAEARSKAAAQGRAALGSAADRLTFSVPAAVRKNAREALELRATLPPSRRGLTPVGLARARDLANGRRVSLAVLMRMVSYFARHEVDKQAPGWGIDSKGWIAWQAWGGDAGRRWAEAAIKRYL